MLLLLPSRHMIHHVWEELKENFDHKSLESKEKGQRREAIEGEHHGKNRKMKQSKAEFETSSIVLKSGLGGKGQW